MLNSIKNAYNNTKRKVAEKAMEKIDFNDPKVKKAMEEQIEKMGVPPQFKQMFSKLMANNPQLLIKIAKETEEEMKKGKSQMAAGQSVMMKYQNELRAAMK